MASFHQIEVYEDREDRFHLYYEDSLHGADLRGILTDDNQVQLIGFDENDNEVVERTISLKEFLKAVLSR